MVKTIVGSFDGYPGAYGAARALIDDGYMQQDVSVVVSNIVGDYTPDGRMLAADYDTNTETGALAGGLVGGAAGLTASLMGLAIPGLGPVVGIGPLVAMLTGAGAGAAAGGLIGALTRMDVSQEHAGYYAESVRRGGALVTLRADDARAERAAEIMFGHGAIDIEQRAMRWRDEGWRGWDVLARPFTAEEVERERHLYGPPSASLPGPPLTPDLDLDRRGHSTMYR